MTNNFTFELQAQKNHARVGVMHTPHGDIETPMFMPVGTQATVKALDSQDLEDLEAQIILANTYHLYLRPGMEDMQTIGGIHQFMNWNKPILTDSGGFQIFSLGADVAKIMEHGVEFRSHLDGSKHLFTPEKAVEIQRQIGADIIMAFDECTPDKADQKYAREALTRTHNWALASHEYWQSQDKKSVYGQRQALFGIIQGAMHQDMRQESAKYISNLDFDGIAVGGETIGYNMRGTVQVMDWIRDILPADKPHYAMGLGLNPQDLVDAVLVGFDMFDCVAPTRIARNGALYQGKLEIDKGVPKWISDFKTSRLQISNRKFAVDNKVLQDSCTCYTCRQGYSRAYLHHLYKTRELSYFRLASIHNLHVLIELSKQLRRFIMNG